MSIKGTYGRFWKRCVRLRHHYQNTSWGDNAVRPCNSWRRTTEADKWTVNIRRFSSLIDLPKRYSTSHTPIQTHSTSKLSTGPKDPGSNHLANGWPALIPVPQPPRVSWWPLSLLRHSMLYFTSLFLVKYLYYLFLLFFLNRPFHDVSSVPAGQPVTQHQLTHTQLICQATVVGTIVT